MTRIINADDPRLTAYVLGELSGDDLQQIEEEIENTPELAAEVVAIRALVGVLEEGLADEVTPQLSDAQRTAILSEAPTRSRRFWQRSSTAVAMAASLALVVGLAIFTMDRTRNAASFTMGKVDQGQAEESASEEPKPSFAPQTEAPSAIRETEAVVERDLAQQGTSPLDEAQPGDAESLGRLSEDSARTTKEIALIRQEKQSAPSRTGSAGSASGTASRPTARTAAAPPPTAQVQGQVISNNIQRDGFGGGGGGGFRGLGQGDSNANGIASDGVTGFGIDAKAGVREQVTEVPQLQSGAGELGYQTDDSYHRAFIVPKPPTEPWNYPQPIPRNAEQYDPIIENPFRNPREEPLSTFSVDVDTGAYTNLRRFLRNNQRPDPNAVRIEELINYFDYSYPDPVDGHPVSIISDIAACPWNPQHRVARVALKARSVANEARPPSNFVFLLDVSGSMRDHNKLPLLKEGMKLLVEQLQASDRVAIVTYAGNAQVVLDSTACNNKGPIFNAINSLNAGGSTNGEAGMRTAYELAKRYYIDEGDNRVLWATDGDFNVGVTHRDGLLGYIKEQADHHLFLTVIGMGMGNIKDGRLEQIADKGNGQYAYIDSLGEAKRLFVDKLTGTLVTVAKDVKLQVEFNPAAVRAYRLIGYENRVMAARDFNDDTKDAGEMGAGHTVTALYEIVPASLPYPATGVDELKYQSRPEPELIVEEGSGETFTVKVRYKAPKGRMSTRFDVPVTDNGMDITAAHPDFKFTAAVAEFGLLLRNSQHRAQASVGNVLNLLQQAQGAPDPHGHRAEFQQLVAQTQGWLR